MVGWYRVATWLAVVGCTSSTSGTGSLAYVERDTQNLRVLDLATEQSSLIDPGRFATVSIAPDGEHVSYAGADEVVKLADRNGTVTPLPSGGCGGDAGRWITSSVMTYCVSKGTMVLAGLATPPRFVESYNVAVTNDGTLDAYVNARNEVVLENIDGTDARVLVPSIAPTLFRGVAGFTPDQQHLIVTDDPSTHIVALDGASVDFTGLQFGSTPFGAQVFLGASMFSPDGTEMLMQSEHALVAVTLATGTVRPIAAFESKVTSGGAVFLDAGRVLWVRIEDHSVGDIGSFTASLHIADPSGDLAIADRAMTMWNAIAVLPNGTIALPSDPLFLDADGTALVANNAAVENILGITGDGTSIITFSTDGTLRRIDLDGTAHDLALSWNTGGRPAAFTSSAL